ncbi:Protein of unknown function [Terribacillus aidingensis]|uniref:DUF3951 domain-containing protein n=1 Tax=Terribacillus aidingensis TaxID=586416 RepID=A0A285N231_9BACI|nr:DUF3951 domain-containing protein [Terribacillus aidingensis]SNZ02847.1 Protein of unknown function [Terribacillus aidingensis]
MPVLLLLTIGFSFGIILLIGLSLYKLLCLQAVPDNSYTPFDYITSVTQDEFHEEKRETIIEAKQGGDV